MPVGLAIAGIGAAGGIASALIGSNAADRASQLQAQSAQNALNFQQGVFDWQKQAYTNQLGWQQGVYNNQYGVNQSNIAPYISAGQNATNTLDQLAKGNYSSFTTSPDYNFALQQGTRGVTNYENSQGMGLSGGALKDISEFNQGLATQQYGNYFNRLLQIAQMGGNVAVGNPNNSLTASAMGSTGQLTSGAMSAAGGASGTIGNTIQGIGQAQASGVIGSANAWMGGINGGISNGLLAAGISPSAYKNLTGGLGSLNLGQSLFGGGSPSGYGAGA